MRDVEAAVGNSAEFLNGKGWFNLDWILNPKNLTKLLEGKYENREKAEEDKSWMSDSLKKEIHGVDG